MKANDLKYLNVNSPTSQIDWMVRRCLTVKREQLYRFFSDIKLNKSTVDAYVNALVKKHFMEYLEADDMLVSRSVISIDDEANEVRIKYPFIYQIESLDVLKHISDLMWVVTSFGSTKVRDVVLSRKAPAMITFLTNDTAYQVANVRYAYEGKYLAEDFRRYSYTPRKQNANEADEMEEMDNGFYRIALVNSEDLARQISACGFDCYCMLDENMVPLYYSFG